MNCPYCLGQGCGVDRCDSGIITIAEDRECDSCGFKGSLSAYKGSLTNKIVWLFCEICASTLAGNSKIYARQYDGEDRVMQMLAYCTNLILEAIHDKR